MLADMRDMFDDFMEELRRRQAEQQRRQSGDQSGTESTGAGDEGSPKDVTGGQSGEGGPEPSIGGTGTSDEETPGAEEVPEEEERIRRPVFGGPGRGGFGRPPRRPRGVGPGGEMPTFSIGRGWIILAVLFFVVLPLVTGFLTFGINLWTDAIWYGSVGFASVFWTRIGSQVGFFVLGTAIALAFLWFNVWLPGRFIPKGKLRRFSLDDFMSRMTERFESDRYPGRRGFTAAGRGIPEAEMLEVPDFSRPLFWVLLAIAALVGLGLGGVLSGAWTTIQLWLHQVPFGQQDPVFHRDISFYLFELPFLRLAQSYVNNLILIAFALAGVRYLVAVVSGAPMPTAARLHLGILFGLFLFSVAFGYQLDKLELVYSGQGVATGVSFTDANARFLALDALTVIAALAGAFVIGLAYTRWRWPLVLTIVVWAVAYVGLVGVYPQLVQRFAVVPNQQNQEQPYIVNNLTMTRLAFGINGWNVQTTQPETSVSAQALSSEPATLQNVRLWDYRPLQTTLDGIQVIRQYYSFNDIDTDRYTFTDPSSCAPAKAPCVRQVMLAARDLDYSKLDQSWVNQHVTYTHGIGVAMVPVNEVVATGSGGGQPRLLISNLPPTSTGGAPAVKVPQIYFGTQESNYVVVDGASQEFDYPASSGTGNDTYTTWQGHTGVKLDNLLTRMLFAARFGDLNMLISNQISGSSQLLFNQSITDRAAALVPFLRLDKDPYLVVTSAGRLVYILDAYTTSSAFPNAQSYDPSTEPTANSIAGDPFNYVRNSVKIVMDAYDGSMSFYVSDPSDPIIRAYEGVFPGLFTSMDKMPSDIKAHIRYPEAMFNAQTTMFERYHVTDPAIFYQGNDVWQAARTSPSSGGGSGPDQLNLEAYYMEMRLPNEPDPEFLLLQPMVPESRPNMIAWVAARNDLPQYGKVAVFNFPRNSSIFGPSQMQALFAQNRDISQQITLWSQQGSQVILGNLLVVPLQNSILYIEPVYLQAAQNPLPVFQKVIVATPSQIVWGDSLSEAVTAILQGRGSTPGGGASPPPSASPGPSATPAPSPTASGPISSASLPPNATAQQLIAAANQHYLAAQTALRAGDLATYQKEMNTVGELITQAERLLGTPAPSAP